MQSFSQDREWEIFSGWFLLLWRVLYLMDAHIHYHPNQTVKGRTIIKHSRTTTLTGIIPGKPGCTIIQLFKLIYLRILAYILNCLRIMIFLYHSFSSFPSLFPSSFLPPFSVSLSLSLFLVIRIVAIQWNFGHGVTSDFPEY